MKSTPVSHRRLLRVSGQVYRALLALYPPAFRREFGPHMAQMFRDVCGEALRSRGAGAVVRLWLPTLGDLLVSAAAERLQEGTAMSRTTLVRAGGIVTIVGGALNVYVFVVHPMGLLRAAVPLSIACLLFGVAGLHLLLWGREGRLGWLGFISVGLGLLLGLIGMAGSALGVLDPNPVAPVINMGEHAGLVFIGAGMLLWGIVALRVGVFGRWSVVPLVLIGLIGLSGITFLAPQAFSALESSVVPVIFAACWIGFGVALVSRRMDVLATSRPAA